MAMPNKYHNEFFFMVKESINKTSYYILGSIALFVPVACVPNTLTISTYLQNLISAMIS